MTTISAPGASPVIPVASSNHPIACDLCNEKFVNDETFRSHQRSETERNPPSVKFLKGAPLLEKCRSAQAMWAAGWVRVRPTTAKGKLSKTKDGVWHQPVVKLRPHKVTNEDHYKCILCRKVFRDVVGFQAHHIHTFLEIERCLDKDELRSLYFEESTNGIWRVAIGTQYLPSQIARLATVRQELAAFEAKKASQEVRGGYSDNPPQNREEISSLESSICEGRSSDLESPNSDLAARLETIATIATKRANAKAAAFASPRSQMAATDAGAKL